MPIGTSYLLQKHDTRHTSSRARAFTDARMAEMVVDWSMLVIGLNRAGLSDQIIANTVGRARSMVVGWRCEKYSDLKYHDGERMIAMWRTHTAMPVPMREKYGMSGNRHPPQRHSTGNPAESEDGAQTK